MTDVLSSNTPLTRQAVPWMAAIAIGTTAVLVAAVGTAVAVVGSVGGGEQPEDVLPSTSVAMVKVDLDPPFAQQKAVYDLSKKFPSVHADSVGSIKDDLLSSLFYNESDLAYATDIKPWLGDRAAVAAVPSSNGFAPIAAIQYTDKEKATKALTRAQSKSTGPDSFAFAFAFDGDYVIVANTKAEADRYADSHKHLADSDTF